MFRILIPIQLFIFFVFANQTPEVKIDQGILRGKYQQTWKGKTFSSFTGIPYAKPPIGDLRFKTAVPAGNWNGVLDASKPHPVCPQMNVYFSDHNVIGDEDCLYLNVYTPKLPVKKLLPVLYYIHGGGWMCGSAAWYGPELLLDKDVILVMANYRLGPLGFLSTGDEVVPGNNGLKDQNLALKWIKKNIKQFGGNPEKITVIGQSAGGGSTHFHMLSPLSRDLIAGAISLSGTSVGIWGITPKGMETTSTKQLAEFLNCPTTSSQEIVDCLRKVKAEDIIKQDPKFLEWTYDPMIPFKPVIEPNIEGAFLPEDPIDIIKSGKAAKVPFMTGLTSEDGAMKSAFLYNDSSLIQELDKKFLKLAPLLFLYRETAPDLDYVSQKIREFYFGDRNIDSTSKSELTNMFTDGWFLLTAHYAVQLHLKYTKQPVYYYLFAYRGSGGYGKLFGDPLYDYGVCHCDDLIYFLNNKLLTDYKPNQSDIKMSDIIVTILTNFANTGNPTPEVNSLIPTKWTPVVSNNMEFYNIKSDSDMKMNEGLYMQRAKFWRNLPLDPRRNEVRDEL